MKKFFLLSVLMLLPLLASAALVEINGIYYNLKLSTAEVTRAEYRDGWTTNYTKYTGDVVIPETIEYNGNVYVVTSIGVSAFEQCTELTSVIIGENVNNIGSDAFWGCQGITSVTIPESVNTIGHHAFSNCTSLKSITFKSIYKEGEKLSIDRDAFSDCESLTSVHITDIAAWCNIEASESFFSNPLSLAHHLFLNDEEIKDLVIPNNVVSINQGAFNGCTSLTSVTIGNSVTSIGSYAFSGCSGLTSVTIPNSVTSIGAAAFSGCSGLTSVTIPNSVTSIDNSTFSGCSSLVSIKVENGNTKYDSRNDCNAIIETHSNNLIAGCKNTIIPNSVTSIGDRAFYGCEGLTSITIPNSVASIGFMVFFDCSSLTSIKVESGNTKYDSRNDCNAIIETHSNNLIAGCKTTIIPNSVTSIGERAFQTCSGLTSVTIPNSVTSIGECAFSGCTGLTSVTIPNSVTFIDEFAFSGCSSLTSITIPNSVASIGEYAFSRCTGLTSVTIPNSVTSIGAAAFLSCSGLTSVTIPNSVTSIGEDAFGDCTGLTSITIPNSVATIGDLAFSNCTGLTEVRSMIEQPFAINKDVFLFKNPESSRWEFTTATLYVPSGTKEKYMATDGWKNFQNIVDMQMELNPIDGETTVKTDQLNGQDLSDNVVGDVYYNVGNDGYDATDQSIVISETTNMGQITNAVPGSADVKENFTGIILKVAKGKGVINVNAKTSGNAQLVVQVGNGTPMIASKSVKGDVEVSYDVEEDTYVYIYAILGSSAARATRASSDGEVRIYGITIRPGATGISSIVKDNNTDAPIYNLSGQRLSVPRKGINIINGKKVVVK